MNIFICWSERRSKELAIAMSEWLPKFIPNGLVKPFLSLRDIPKGTLWFEEVNKNLGAANAGLICVTPESLRSGWIHFEAGALAKALWEGKKGRIYTYLHGIEPNDLKGPLGEFQSTRSTREDTKNLIESIVSSMGEDAPPKREEWEKAFNEHWDGFYSEVSKIKPRSMQELLPDLEKSFRRKTFEEPLSECSRQSWIERYGGAWETFAELKKHEQTIKADGSYLQDLYELLLSQLDGYAMDMAALLLSEKQFALGDDGKLAVPEGIRKPCERRRNQVRRLVTQMLTPDGGPVHDKEARRFVKMTTFEEKKALLIYPMQQKIELKMKGGGGEAIENEIVITEETLRKCAISWWEFDRIFYYLVQENCAEPQADQLVKCISQELEKLKSKEEEGSLIPMHYALRAVRTALKSARINLPDERISEIEDLMSKVKRHLKKTGQDEGGQVKDNISEIMNILNGAKALGCQS
jgi:hypothetical protein